MSKVDLDNIKLRNVQKEAIKKTKDGLNIIQMPTGSGKSIYSYFATGKRTMFVTKTFNLTKQYREDFGLFELKGSANYDCLQSKHNCRVCNKSPRCSDCLYLKAKQKAYSSHKLILNSSLFWRLAINTDFLTNFHGYDLVIDEGDSILESVHDSGKVILSKELIKTYNLFNISDIGLRTIIEGMNESDKDFFTLNAFLYIINVYEELDRVENETEIIFAIFNKDILESMIEDVITFFNKIILMSATMDIEILSKIKANRFSLPSEFPLKNRKIVWTAKYKIKYGNLYIDEIAKSIAILSKKHQKGLIHVSSYENAIQYYDKLFNVECFIHNKYDRLEVIEEFKKSPTGFLISPYAFEGVDFTDIDCQFITKTPFVNPNDEIIKKFKENWGDQYLQEITAKRLVQTYGRGNRNKEQVCTTYIYDSNLNILRNEFVKYPYFLEALRHADIEYNNLVKRC